jgi:hypothetical protein
MGIVRLLVREKSGAWYVDQGYMLRDRADEQRRVESSGVRMPDVEARDDHGKDFAATSGKDWKPTSPVDGVMCSYREYDPDTGETYACGLREHLPKVRHTRGAVV